ncbi:hypothetical protein HGH93_08440 [Chitinophaga polysaccharea]|uniref:hypothetical protein n=1 Tax=Chitinophaga TaxID=79328 RepID=UPI001455714D|nr:MULTISPECIES: hypothetical protein [Chitinophaga]NLR58124.1 hypothetical protein [Chitinophaga polysaccharea]NLU90662.1 hypothetical protein [Chitinophaga sp. Ak27]
MKKVSVTLQYPCVYALILFFSSLPGIVRAQSSGPGNVVVDGQLKEWGDTLRHYDKAAQLYYDVYNDHDFLYIALRRPKFAWKMVLAGRMSFEISKDKEDKDGIKIFYPGHYSFNKDDMWNFLEIKKAGETSFDTLTIYNDYGIQASGGFWEKQEQGDRKSSASDMLLSMAPTNFNDMQAVMNKSDKDRSGVAINTIVGADCELAIPMKLLPVTSGTVYIRIVIPGEKNIVDALNGVGYYAGFNMDKGSADAVEDLLVASKLSITYRLK